MARPTKDQIIQELIKCRNDFGYFANKYVIIQHPRLGFIPFKLYEFQDRVFKDYNTHRFNIIKKPRQMGLSTLTSVYLLWLALFNPAKEIMIISIGARESKEFLKHIKVAFERLPTWLRGKLASDNKSTMEFDNKSRIQSIPSPKYAARSFAASILVIDEAAFIQNIESLWTSAFPILSTGGKAIVLSTVNGTYGTGHWFYQKWTEAEQNLNNFNPIALNYQEHPEYVKEGWAEEQRKDLGELKFSQEVLCFPKGTDIITIDGIKDISDIVPGDHVLTHSNRFRRVRRIFCREYDGELIKISRYGNNMDIMCTPEHPIRITDGISYSWKKAINIEKNDRLTTSRLLCGKRKIISEDLAVIIAWYIPEGWVSNNTVYFALNAKDDYKRLVIAIKNFIGRDPIVEINEKTCNIRISDSQLGEFLIKHCGLGSYNKKLPLELIDTYEKLVYDILISGDGHRRKERDGYITISKTLAYQVFLLAQILGFPSSIRKIGTGGKCIILGREVNYHIKYAVSIYKNQSNKQLKLIKHKLSYSASIHKIEKQYYNGKVYNFEVEGDNSYTANGTVVHNCDFLGSVNTFISREVINRYTDLENKGISPIRDPIEKRNQEMLWIWDRPVPGHYYIMGVDVAKHGNGKSNSAFQIIDISSCSQVAEFSGKLDTITYARIVNDIAKEYNDAFVILEINNMGLAVMNELHNNLQYNNIYFRRTGNPGWDTTAKTRPFIIQSIEQIFSKDLLKILSRRTINELQTFVADTDTGKVQKQKGSTDDLLISLGLTYIGLQCSITNNPALAALYGKEEEDKVLVNAYVQLKTDVGQIKAGTKGVVMSVGNGLANVNFAVGTYSIDKNQLEVLKGFNDFEYLRWTLRGDPYLTECKMEDGTLRKEDMRWLLN